MEQAMSHPVVASSQPPRTRMIVVGRIAIFAGIGVCALALTALAAYPEASLQPGVQAAGVLAFPGQ